MPRNISKLIFLAMTLVFVGEGAALRLRSVTVVGEGAVHFDRLSEQAGEGVALRLRSVTGVGEWALHFDRLSELSKLKAIDKGNLCVYVVKR